MRTVYVNGAYVPETEAKVSVFDRAFLFGDGIYEVASVLGGKLIDFPAHIARLHRSANELGMRIDVSDEDSWPFTANWSAATRSRRAWSTCS
jgi:D-alanine transaminase